MVNSDLVLVSLTEDPEQKQTNDTPLKACVCTLIVGNLGFLGSVRVARELAVSPTSWSFETRRGAHNSVYLQ